LNLKLIAITSSLNCLFQIIIIYNNVVLAKIKKQCFDLAKTVGLRVRPNSKGKAFEFEFYF